MADERINMTIVAHPREALICLSCSSPASPDKKLFTCRGCKIARYCDSQCQRAHWSTHKEECIQLRDLAARDVRMQEKNAVLVLRKKYIGMAVSDDPIKAWGLVAIEVIPKGAELPITPRLFTEQPSPGIDHVVITWYNCLEQNLNTNLPPMYVEQAFLDDVGREFGNVPSSLEALRASGVHLFAISLGIYFGVVYLDGPHQNPRPVRSLGP